MIMSLTIFRQESAIGLCSLKIIIIFVLSYTISDNSTLIIKCLNLICQCKCLNLFSPG